jgi:hypothetical protein
MTEREEELIKQLVNNREELREMLNSVVELRKKTDSLLPNTLADFRNRYMFDEKLKLIASIFDLELKTRDKLDSSIKSELEILRKSKLDDEDKKYNVDDIAEIASMIESFRKTKLKIYDNTDNIKKSNNIGDA